MDINPDSLSSELDIHPERNADSQRRKSRRCLKEDSSKNRRDCGHSDSRLSVRRKSGKDASPEGGGDVRHTAKDNDIKTTRKTSSRIKTPFEQKLIEFGEF